MLTIVLRRLAAAGLFALAVIASSFSTAKADWSISSSCVGTWGLGSCSAVKREFPRDTHMRHVRGFDTEQEAKESVLRDRKWMAFCKPVLSTDRYGVSRYSYAQPGCEFGRSE
jgi:hypothetical protein